MGWGGNAIKKARLPEPEFFLPSFPQATIDWDRLVVLDYETFFSDEYTLRKLSTSEYIRDARFKAQCVGIKVGRKPVKVVPANRIASELRSIPWATHSLLCHHTQFDGFILFEKYGVSPLKLYDTLSMARALHNNDIGAGLDEVSQYYGGTGKLKDILEKTRGVLNWSPALFKEVIPYVVTDVEECLRIFQCMLPKMPADEIELIDRVCRMFTEPLLDIDRPRVQKELERELAEKKRIMLSFVPEADAVGIKLTNAELKALVPTTKVGAVAVALGEPLQEDIDVRRVKKLIGSNAFPHLLRNEGVDPPRKISPSWIKKPRNERTEDGKYTWAFARTDLAFIGLQEHSNPRVRELVEARLSVKSTTNETRAGRFLKTTEGGKALPVYYKYSAAHTHRLGGGDKNNLQNLKRGGELRKSIKAPPGHVIAVKDSGQIEARINGWLWGQDDLLDDFRKADAFEASVAHLPKKERPIARGDDRDAYCKFADIVYGREILKSDDEQRFVGKVAVLALGYQMGPDRLRNTLALGTMGPAVFLSEDECKRIVYAYRRKNFKIQTGWKICERIIDQMARGIAGSHKCISWDKETIYLPNGLTMHYPGLHDKRFSEERIAERVVAAITPELADPDMDRNPDWPEFVYYRKDAEVKIYGGLLCENIVQALARIVVMSQLLEISKKHRVVMTTHDEVAALIKKAAAAKASEFMQKVMMTPPAWCSDIPLNAEGGYDVFYSK